MRAVKVDFRRSLMIRRQPRTTQHGYTTPTHRQTNAHTHSAISTLAAALTPEPVHAAHIADGHCNRLVHGNNACAHPAGPHQPPILAPIGHVRQALQFTPTCTLYSISPKGRAFSTGRRDTDDKHPPQAPIHVPDIRGRALCSKSHGKTTMRSTSSNGARHQVRTIQRIAIRLCFS